LISPGTAQNESPALPGDYRQRARLGTISSMRMPWNKSKEIQLDLLDDSATESPIQWVDGQAVASGLDGPPDSRATSQATPCDADPPRTSDGRPLLVSVARLYEDLNNPRVEFPEAAIEELAVDMQLRGVLQPLVVHPADGEGRYRIHFGAKRLRAAIRVGLSELPVVIRDRPADRYAQVAENQKRHGLTPLELARFIRAQSDAGDSNATIAMQLNMNLTTVAHHLSLLELPSELDEALKSGRCTSPRTLHELRKLHADNPEQVQGLLASGSEITRTAVSALRVEPDAECWPGRTSRKHLRGRTSPKTEDWPRRSCAMSDRCHTSSNLNERGSEGRADSASCPACRRFISTLEPRRDQAQKFSDSRAGARVGAGIRGDPCRRNDYPQVLAAGRARGQATKSRPLPTLVSVWADRTGSRVRFAGLRPPLTRSDQPMRHSSDASASGRR
jgi:ParB family transcriptional regulator, chromosome partitioning protein